MTATLFNNSKYSNIYNMICTRAMSREIDGYQEKHHIIPKSLGGSNDLSNLVRLTPKEHYICHLLLVKMTSGKDKTKMRYALWAFRNSNKHQDRKINSRQYAYLKEQVALANKERPGPNKGKVMSEEQKTKISKSLSGRKLGPQSEEHRAKLGKWKRTDAHRKAISDARKAQTGKQKRSEETKAKMSAWQKGVPKPKYACEHCGKESSLMNYKRWHGDNCKLL